MVKLEEVMDEEFMRTQEGPHDEDDWDTDSDSDESDTDSIAPEETFYDRLTALRDIIPAPYRLSMSRKANTVTSWAKTGLTMGGKTLWVVSTSVLLLGVPWGLAYAEEQTIIEQEREMMAQQKASEFLTPGAQPAAPAGAQAAL